MTLRRAQVLAGIGITMLTVGIIAIAIDKQTSSGELLPEVSQALSSQHKSEISTGGVIKEFNNGKCKLRQVGVEDLAEQMLKPVFEVSAEKRPGVWEKMAPDLPKRMRGIWWHSYTTTVNTFLYTKKPSSFFDKLLEKFGGETNKETVVVDLFAANAWSAKDQPAIQGGNTAASDKDGIVDAETNRKNKFAYIFNFHKTGGSDEYNWANVAPGFFGLKTDAKIFAMFAQDVCSNCREKSLLNTKAGTAHVALSDTDMTNFLSSQKRAQTCKDYTTPAGHTEPGADQCWRRISGFTEFNPGDKSVPVGRGFRYDVVKIVNEYGEKIQPNYDNWVKALKNLKTPRGHILLPDGDC